MRNKLQFPAFFRRPTARQTTAFTLIELLVVIAILAILAGTLLPTLARAKSKANTARFLSNLKQFGLTFLLYSQENSDHFHFSGRIWPYLPMVDLMNMFDPYISTNGSAFYVCPADKLPAWTRANIGFGTTTNQLLFGDSYYYYHSFYNDDSQNDSLQQRSAEQVRLPSGKAITSCATDPKNIKTTDWSLAQ